MFDDAHERDGGGLDNNYQDGIIDLINNIHGRELGKKLIENGTDLTNPRELANFLNNSLENILKSNGIETEINLFNQNQQSVQELSDEF